MVSSQAQTRHQVSPPLSQLHLHPPKVTVTLWFCQARCFSSLGFILGEVLQILTEIPSGC